MRCGSAQKSNIVLLYFYVTRLLLNQVSFTEVDPEAFQHLCMQCVRASPKILLTALFKLDQYFHPVRFPYGNWRLAVRLVNGVADEFPSL